MRGLHVHARPRSRADISRFPKAIFAAVLAYGAVLLAGGDTGTHEVEGDCLVGREGVLVVYVVDAERFATPLAGTRELRLRISPVEVAAGRVRFSFRLPAGRYGIRCFLDLNGNGRLDKGLFGPAEPWGMSWSEARRPGFPKFDDIAFLVDKDVRGLQIEVK